MRLQLDWLTKFLLSCLGLALLTYEAAGLAAPPPEPDDIGVVDAQDPSVPKRGVRANVELHESVYADTDLTYVSTSVVNGSVTGKSSGVTFHGSYMIDALSSASVDVLSSASQGWIERRQVGSVGAGIERGQWQADAGYAYSIESDWESHTGTATLGRDFNSRNTNLSLGYFLVDNRIGHSRDPSVNEAMLTNALNLSLTQVLGKRTTSRFTAFYSHNKGFLSSPYRLIPVGRGALANCRNDAPCVAEVHPGVRHRFAAQATIGHFIPRRRDQSLFASYRLYGDDWGVFSHTLDLYYRVQLSERWVMRLQSRTYFQDSARFYRPAYDAEERYMSADRELSTFIHQMAGLKLTRQSRPLGPRGARLSFDMKLDVSTFRFFNFPRLPLRLSAVGEVGLRLAF